MAIDRSDREERQALLDVMIEEFRTAQQRRLAKTRDATKKPVEADQRAMACVSPLPADKVH